MHAIGRIKKNTYLKLKRIQKKCPGTSIDLVTFSSKHHHVAGICKIYTIFMTKALATSNISCILHYYFVDFIEKHTTLAQDVDLLLEWFSDTNKCSNNLHVLLNVTHNVSVRNYVK